jgi:hypothetical protein
MPRLVLEPLRPRMDVSVLMISTEWEKIYIYFWPPLEITVVLTKKYKCRANLRT